MKLCYISGSYPPIKDGVGDWTSHILSLLKTDADMDIYIIFHENANIHFDKKKMLLLGFKFNNIIKILSFIKNNSIDCVHIEYPCICYGLNLSINFLPLLMKIVFPKIKIFLTIHEYSNYTIKGKLRILLMLLFSNIVFVTDKRNYYRLNRIKGNVHSVLPVPPQIPVKRKRNYRQKNKYLTFGYWGFIRKNKGIDVLIRSFKRYLLNGYKGKLILYASFDEKNSYQNSILKLIKKIEIENNIEIKGYLSKEDLSIELSHLDCCILPFADGVSDRRGTFVAAMACGLPVITTVVEEEFITTGLKHNENVFLTPFNERDICKAMIKLQDDSLRLKLGDAASEWAKTHSWENIKTKLLKGYKSIK